MVMNLIKEKENKISGAREKKAVCNHPYALLYIPLPVAASARGCLPSLL
jgi:hypothetical protein